MVPGPDSPSTCTDALATTAKLQAVCYSEYIPSTTIIDPFRDQRSFTVSIAPTTISICGYLTQTVYPTYRVGTVTNDLFSTVVTSETRTSRPRRGSSRFSSVSTTSVKSSTSSFASIQAGPQRITPSTTQSTGQTSTLLSRGGQDPGTNQSFSAICSSDYSTSTIQEPSVQTDSRLPSPRTLETRNASGESTISTHSDYWSNTSSSALPRPAARSTRNPGFREPSLARRTLTLSGCSPSSPSFLTSTPSPSPAVTASSSSSGSFPDSSAGTLPTATSDLASSSDRTSLQTSTSVLMSRTTSNLDIPTSRVDNRDFGFIMSSLRPLSTTASDLRSVTTSTRALNQDTKWIWSK